MADLLDMVQMENLDEEQKVLAELIGLEGFKNLVRAFNGTEAEAPTQRFIMQTAESLRQVQGATVSPVPKMDTGFIRVMCTRFRYRWC